MKRVAVLLDFTPLSKLVVDNVLAMSELSGADLILFHICESNEEEAQGKMKVYEKQMRDSAKFSLVSSEVKKGDFFGDIGPMVSQYEADLTIVGTHGKRGLKQNLFGSNILKLVKLLPSSTLILHDNSNVQSIKKVLMPTSTDSDIAVKIERTISFVGKTAHYLFHGIKVNQSMDEVLMARMKMAREMMQKLGTSYEVVLEEIKVFSPGFSKQTLTFLDTHPSDLISLSIEANPENAFYSGNDTENIILNHAGVAVLCIK